jgi:restriction endonuclease
MTPEEYEDLAAQMLRAEGWDARVTPYTHDFGVDVIAERAGTRLAVQAKMFGGANRPIAGTMVMQLHGAAAYADCSKAMIVTDGRVLDEAREIGGKLGIEIRFLPAVAHEPEPAASDAEGHVEAPALTFGRIWRDHVMPLAGTTLTRANGKSNEILRVDAGGLERRSSTGRPQKIDIEIFRWAIECMLRGETVSRDDINARYPKRASSGIALILTATPLFEQAKVGGRQALRMRRAPAV